MFSRNGFFVNFYSSEAATRVDEALNWTKMSDILNAIIIDNILKGFFIITIIWETEASF